MKLFDVIPQNFFNLLSSPNKDIYADCIFIIYDKMLHFTSFGVGRDIIIDVLTDYFESIEDENVFIEDNEIINGARNKANTMIRKLHEYGWIDLEMNYNYVQTINFFDYAVAIIESMNKLKSNERLEYQGYVYSIYTLLFSEEKMLPSIMLEQVMVNVRQLVSGLKTLNSNIRKYIDTITKLKTAKEIMNLQFNDYEVNIIDKSYHRLKTSDNVSKFRPKIISKLEEISRDKNIINEISQQFVDMEKLDSFENSYQFVRKQLNDAIDSLMHIDVIIREIDHKHYKYLRSSLTRVKFILNNKKDLEGQINEILKYIVSVYHKGNIDLNEDFFEMKLFDLYPQSFIDNKSLYVSSEGRKSFDPVELDEDKVMSSFDREKQIALFKERNQNRLTKSTINDYVFKCLNGRKVMNASELPLNTIDDFIKMMYIIIFAKSRLTKYKIKFLHQTIHYHEYTFDDFEIWRI